jgi:hypothetical protein
MTQTHTDIARVADELLDAYNQSDWERLRRLVASDVVYIETGTGRRIEGVDAYLELCERWKRAFPARRAPSGPPSPATASSPRRSTGKAPTPDRSRRRHDRGLRSADQHRSQRLAPLPGRDDH